jgi:hypothetical protein
MRRSLPHLKLDVGARRIAQLEASLGTRLFQRTTRQVRLTEAGEVISST